MAKKKVVLAFSGGLDTSFALNIYRKNADTTYIQPLPTPEVLIKRN